MRSTWSLPVTIFFLGCISLLILRSVASNLVEQQFFFFVIGFIIFFITSGIPFYKWKSWSWVLYTGLLFLLAATLIIGNATRGSTRWIELGSFHIQTSQLAVPIVALFVTRFLSYNSINSLKNFFLFVVATAIPAVLIMIEPDLGTTVVFILSLGILLFFSQFQLKYILASLLVGVIGVAVSWLFLLQPYQKERITSFLSPTLDLSGSGYNAYQSLIAVGSGQIYGKGLGQGIQSHLRFLPERQTDFVFASLAEELGFMGSMTVIVLYIYLLSSMVAIAETSSETEKLYVYAITTLFSIQILVNIGMNIGLLPITGLTLPLISYGGSSILSLFFSLGLLQSLLKKPYHHRIMAITA